MMDQPYSELTTAWNLGAWSAAQPINWMKPARNTRVAVRYGLY